MRIIYDHQIVGSQEVGGASRYVYELARAMSATHRQDVRIVAPLYANSYLKSSGVKVIGMPIRRLPRTGRIILALNSLVAPAIIRLLHPDIVHETYYSPRRVAPGGARVVQTVYDMIHERFRSQFPPGDSTTRDKAAAIARADHVICISEQTRQDLVDILNVDPAKTSVVHLGFALTSGPRSSPAPSISDGRPFLLYVGHRGGYKNFARLLQAYASFPILRASFDLICFGGGRFTGAEVRAIRELGLSPERVRQTGGDDARLEAHYRLASALVYPSLYEGFGIPPLEAMSFDCPVVASDAGSIAEVVGDAAEPFDPYNLESIGTTIERVVSDGSLRERLIARGRARLAQFSWTRCAEETFDVYQRLL